MSGERRDGSPGSVPGADDLRESAGLYVHVPFCRRKCPYCHFASAPAKEGEWSAWRAGIEREAVLRAAEAGGTELAGAGGAVGVAGVANAEGAANAAGGLEFDTLYFGGGTPSLLTGEEMGGIVAALGRSLRVRAGEFTLEANPASDADETRMRGWAAAGVTRLSVGAQSFDDGTLAVLGRDYRAEEAEAYAVRAKRAGFDAIGLDLMLGVPGETTASIDRTLAAVDRSAPDHVSLYLLEAVEGLPFEAVLRERPVDDDAAADAFEAAAERLERMGLRRYEISNFARPGRECRHNLKYWRGEPFLGLGPSAASRLGRLRWTNIADIGGWDRALAERTDPRAEIVALDGEREMIEALVSGLRLVGGIDLADFERRFGVDPAVRYAREIAALRADGLLILEGGVLRIPKEKLLVSNGILSSFV